MSRGYLKAIVVAVLLVAMAGIVLPAWADPLELYTNPIGGSGARWTSLHAGFKFSTEARPISVTALGAWDGPSPDASGSIGDGLMGNMTVSLWAETNLTSPIAQIVVPAGSGATLLNGFRYVNLSTALTLDPHTPYRISSVSSAAGDQIIHAYGPVGGNGLTNAAMNSYISLGAISYWGNVPPTAPVNVGGNQGWVGPNLLFNPLAPIATQTLIEATAVAVASEWSAIGRIKEKTTMGVELRGPKPLTKDGSFPTQFSGVDDLWNSYGAANPYITWDLGASETVDSIYFWNYNIGGGYNLKRGISNATIKVADSLGGPWTTVQNVTLNMATGTDSDPGQWVPLSGPLPTARYVMFTNIVAGDPTDLYMGISDIAFYRVIPEPGTLLLLAGGALVMLARRRR
jgi:hypothetical protein